MVIRLSNLQKYYDKEKVLDIESFLFEEKVYCLLGKNGAGKTTLLKILAGLDRHYRGKIWYEEPEGRIDDIQKYATMVFQTSYVLDSTVAQNIEYGLRVRGLDEELVRQKTQYYLELTNLFAMRDKNARKLSAGQQQRLCFARAIATRPRILLLDEPVSNLDEENKEIIHSILRTYGESGKTIVVMVTHEAERARELTKNIVYLDEKGLRLEAESCCR